MTDREAMQQALEALIKAHPYSNSNKDLDGHSEAIAALRERLAQPEHCQCPECRITPHASDCAVHNEPAYPKGACNCQAQPEREQYTALEQALTRLQKRYGELEAKVAAQRQPLTDEEIGALRQQYGVTSDGRGIKEFTYVLDFARAVEAAHGIGEKT